MAKFTIELDEIACKWLAHISELTGKPIERAIESVVYQQIIAIEDNVFRSFTGSFSEGVEE